MACNTVFIISVYPEVRDRLAELVASAGLRARQLSSLETWLEAAGPETEGCLVLDTGAGELLEPGRLASFASICARIPVLVLTERGDVPTAVNAVRHGAVDVLQKPIANRHLLERIQNAVAVKEAGAGEPFGL